MAPPDLSVLVSGGVLFVTGKGGVGKTTLAAAIGRLAAAQGRRTLVLEVDNQHPTLPGIFGAATAYEPVEVEKNLFIANIAWAPALEDWVESIVSMRRLVRLIMKNRVVSLFLQVTPGARDLVMLWRTLELSTHYDLVIVDLPASGNAVAMMSVPLTAERLFPTGPIRRCADEILALYARPSTSVVLVALPEEMVVNETLETTAKLTREVRGLHVPLILLNRASVPSFSPEEHSLLTALEGLPDLSPDAVDLLNAGRWEESLEAATGEALTRLAGAGRPIVVLPAVSRREGARRTTAMLTAALARLAGLRAPPRGAS
jgi:energy-coupling factor transporter ATP-binding protein EcfA2